MWCISEGLALWKLGNSAAHAWTCVAQPFAPGIDRNGQSSAAAEDRKARARQGLTQSWREQQQEDGAQQQHPEIQALLDTPAWIISSNGCSNFKRG
jgi:hypothetical protein